MKSIRRLPIALALGALFCLPPLAGAAEDDPDYEAASVRFQTTYNHQTYHSFRDPYSNSATSLPGDKKYYMYTFSTTAHFGFRPWQGGEVYFDPELSQGIPFSSNLVGLGGFTNGEITRAAGPNPMIYRQRLFLRQTWNRGGGTEHLDAGLNQLAGTVDKNRFVLTVGNFATLDVFDQNAYAKDPRTQFMNWGNMTYAAYDYAADARGFSWGFAGEWYQDDWVLRFGRMTGPRDPNMLQQDYQYFKHYGDQVEVEHAHDLAGQPGKVRVLFWRNRARLASFKDALAYGAANPGAFDGQYILGVRNSDKFKYGIGLNVEQAINDNVGVFLRAMTTDGRTETLAFTEVDGSLATGTLIKGNRWGRPDDRIGLSLLRNTLSKNRRDYLESGAISFFIGDGRLNYRPETIFEGFYSWALAKDMSLTADFQRIQNPAYNADRGPVNVTALRFHAEY